MCQNITLHNYYGIIESPNFPYKYEHNLNCSWTIDAPIGNKVNLTFSHFDVEGLGKNNSCEYDYLKISEGVKRTASKQLAKLCNSDVLPPKIHSSQHQVFLNFVTDSLIAFNGFRLEWTVDGCGGHLTRPFDTFTSPGYPSAYPTDIECEWLIEVDHGHSIELTFYDVGIISSTNTISRDKFNRKLIVLSDKDREKNKLLLRQIANLRWGKRAGTVAGRNLLFAQTRSVHQLWEHDVREIPVRCKLRVAWIQRQLQNCPHHLRWKIYQRFGDRALGQLSSELSEQAKLQMAVPSRSKLRRQYHVLGL